MRRSQLTVLARLMLIALVGSATVATALDERLDPGLSELASGAEDGRRVIVHLKADAAAQLRLSPRGVPQPEARLAAVQRAVHTAVTDLSLETTQSEVQIFDRFQLRPAFSAWISSKGLEVLLERSDVVWIEADQVWRAHTVEGIPLMGADGAHDLGLRGAGTAVAVIDSGITASNPILGGGPIPNDKVVYGLDTGDNDDDPSDCGSHGTSVASLVAGLPHSFAANRSFAGGVAPDAKILAYKASTDADCGSFFSSDIAQAIDDAILHRDEFNVVAINLSIGGGLVVGPCDRMSTAATYGRAAGDAIEAGITVLASSGNEAAKESLAIPSCISTILSVGAVYDVNTNAVFENCEDNQTPAGSPTCYSNSNSYLDVLAPSHFAAAARGSSMHRGTLSDSFGGTSAAAPYAAGGVALVYERYPTIIPGQVRTLLSATGRMTEDTHGGSTKPLLDIGRALSPPESLGIAWDTPVAIESGTTVSSTLEITDRGRIESLRLTLNLFHPRPTNLVVVLRSPAGTEIKLHDQGEGNTPASQVVSGGNGIVGFFPDPIAPVESFDAFISQRASGSWTLEITDLSSTTPFGVPPRLEGWALELETSEFGTEPSPGAFSIPVGIHAGGLNDSFWVTDLRIANPSTSDAAELALFLIPAGTNGNQSFFLSEIEIAANTVASLPDVVLESFSQASIQGNLIFVTDDQLLATSRTYNTGDGNGTYGQFIAMAAFTESFGPGETGWIGQLSKSGAFRTNVGFSEQAGIATTVLLRLFDGDDGSQLGSRSYTLKPFSNLQVNDVFSKLDAPARANAFATLEVTSGGRVLGYASVADNATNDAVFIPASRPTAADQHVVPIVAKIAGAAGTNWSTDLRIINSGNSDAAVTLEFRAIGSDAVISQGFSVGAGRALALTDVLASLGASSASGSIVIRPDDSTIPLLVSSRTFNSTIEGTYGQMILGVTEGFDGSDQITVLNVDQNASFRSNFGVAEVAGGNVTVRYVLKDQTGVTLATDTLELGPWEVIQINAIYNALGVPARSNGRIDVFVDSGDGAIVAYLSVIDKRTGDAIYVPAMSH